MTLRTVAGVQIKEVTAWCATTRRWGRVGFRAVCPYGDLDEVARTVVLARQLGLEHRNKCVQGRLF